jgi:hypothetical protein
MERETTGNNAYSPASFLLISCHCMPSSSPYKFFHDCAAQLSPWRFDGLGGRVGLLWSRGHRCLDGFKKEIVKQQMRGGLF